MKKSKAFERSAIYFLAAEFLFLMCELSALHVIDPANGLLWRPLLLLATLPSSLLGVGLDWYVPAMLGYTHGDLHAFLPRAITWQAPLLLNSVLFFVLVKRRLPVVKKEQSTSSGRTGG